MNENGQRHRITKQRVGGVGLERLDQVLDAALQQVVAEVHDEVVVTQKLAGDQHAMGEPERSILRDERERRAKAFAVAERGHHFGPRVADDLDILPGQVADVCRLLT